MRDTSARVLVAAVALLALSACASRLSGEVSYDDSVDFSRYRSFALAPGTSGTPAARAIAEREVRRALEAKGLREVDRSSADVVARIQLARRWKARLSGSVSPGGEAVGMEVALDDRASGERVWSSWVAETYDESLQLEPEITKAVDLIFESYPPK
jgi:hypothetical protein